MCVCVCVCARARAHHKSRKASGLISSSIKKMQRRTGKSLAQGFFNMLASRSFSLFLECFEFQTLVF